MDAVLFSIASLLSTCAGGVFALKFNKQLHFILSFTAGVLLGVVSFDILPEIFAQARNSGLSPNDAMVALVAGFLFFHSMEKFVLVHHAHENTFAPHHHPNVGILTAFALAGHSFLDGVGIAVAFQASQPVGIAVGVAVVAHDYCDGLNTVSLMLVHRNSKPRSLAMLVLDAVAPVLGAALTQAFQMPTRLLILFLGFFAGFLFYIAASDVLPEAHSRAEGKTTLVLIGLTAFGTFLIFCIVLASDRFAMQ